MNEFATDLSAATGHHHPRQDAPAPAVAKTGPGEAGLFQAAASRAIAEYQEIAERTAAAWERIVKDIADDKRMPWQHPDFAAWKTAAQDRNRLAAEIVADRAIPRGETGLDLAALQKHADQHQGGQAERAPADRTHAEKTQIRPVQIAITAEISIDTYRDAVHALDAALKTGTNDAVLAQAETVRAIAGHLDAGNPSIVAETMKHDPVLASRLASDMRQALSLDTTKTGLSLTP